jgi:hypothetical protein
MTEFHPTRPVCNVAILAAALELQLIFDTGFAMQFLTPYGFTAEVVQELLHPAANVVIEDS